MAGLTATGFETKLPADVLEDIRLDQIASIDPDIQNGPDQLIGQLNAILANKIAEKWDALLAVWANSGEDAGGVSLDRVCALTGVERLEPVASEVLLTLGGTVATVIPAGKRVSNPSTNVSFETVEEATIGGGGTVDVLAECTVAGPLTALAGTVTRIDTPVSGWTSATNADDATPGRNLETDAALRARRRLELAQSGGATADAIRANLLEVEGVTAAFVFHNDTDTTDGDGILAHSVEAVVTCGAAADIALENAAEIRASLHASVAAGIRTHGSESGTVTDASGVTQTIKFTRPTVVGTKANIDIRVDDDVYPEDGDDQVVAAVVAYVNGLGIGADEVRARMFAAVFSITGVMDIVTLQIAKLPDSFGTANIVITNRQIADLQSDDVTLASSTWVDT